MIRALRYTLITVIWLGLIAYGALWVLGGRFIDKAQGPLTSRLVAAFGPGPGDEYGYAAGLRFFPLRVEITGLQINAGALKLGEDTWRDAKLGVDRIECCAMPLIRENRVDITDVSGRTFSGLLTNTELARHLERANEDAQGIEVSPYNGRCRIQGRFGVASAAPVTVIGDWKVDDRGVVTLVNREYHNPDSPVPEGMIRLIEEQVKFEVRIGVLDEDLVAADVLYGREGLRISAGES